jgi:hypothetical protein
VEQFDPRALAAVFVSFHASMAGFSFAGLTFLLAWSRSDELSGPAQAARQRALMAMATAVVVFLTAAAQYALTTANGDSATATWIMMVGTAPASICAAALLDFTIVVLFRAHGLVFATRIARRLFDFAYLTLAGYLLFASLGGTAAIAFAGVPIAQLPAWFLAAALVAVAVPMATVVVAPRWPLLARFAGGDDAFERLVLTVLAVVGSGLVVTAIAFVTQIEAVNAEIWIVLVLAALVGVSTSLCHTRFVLTQLLGETGIAPLSDGKTATEGAVSA